MKGSRLITHRSTLADGGDFVQRFFESGISELGHRLGPILWQFSPGKRFDEADFGKFLELLPAKLGDRKLNHVVEVRHGSFNTPVFVDLARKLGVTIAYTDAAAWPNIADLTGDVVYARLQRGDDKLETAYPVDELDAWAERAKSWAQGHVREDLKLLSPDASEPGPSISSMKANCACQPGPGL